MGIKNEENRCIIKIEKNLIIEKNGYLKIKIKRVEGQLVKN